MQCPDMHYITLHYTTPSQDTNTTRPRPSVAEKHSDTKQKQPTNELTKGEKTLLMTVVSCATYIHFRFQIRVEMELKPLEHLKTLSF